MDQTDCLDAMIGRSSRQEFQGVGHPYVYVVIQHTGRETRRYLYVRSEDEHGRPVASTRFKSLLLDQRQINYVDAGFFSAQLEILLYPHPSVTHSTIGPGPIELPIDWFLFTPDTTIAVRAIPDEAREIQRRLQAYNASRTSSDQIWRVNTTGLPIEAPRRAIDPWATCNPWRIEPTRNWDVAVEKTNRGGRTFFTVHLVRDAGHDLRRMFQSIEWTVARNGRVVDRVANLGYTLERATRWGDGPVDITVRVTQTSPVTYPPFAWRHNSSTECPDAFGPAVRTHTYRFDPARGLFAERD
jgi:hypothetical protein